MDQEHEVVGEESEEEDTFGRLNPEHSRYFRDPDDTGSDEEEVEEIPDLPSLQGLMDSDSEEDMGEGQNVNDQARQHEDEGPAAADEDEEDDDGLFHEADDDDEEPDVGEELFDQWDENEADVEAIGPQAVPVGAAARALARAGNQVGGAAPAPAGAVGDNEEGNVEDDMEGAMEG